MIKTHLLLLSPAQKNSQQQAEEFKRQLKEWLAKETVGGVGAIEAGVTQQRGFPVVSIACDYATLRRIEKEFKGIVQVRSAEETAIKSKTPKNFPGIH